MRIVLPSIIKAENFSEHRRRYRPLRQADNLVQRSPAEWCVYVCVNVCVCVCVCVCLIVGELETGGLGRIWTVAIKKNVTERMTWRDFLNTVIHMQSNS